MQARLSIAGLLAVVSLVAGCAHPAAQRNAPVYSPSRGGGAYGQGGYGVGDAAYARYGHVRSIERVSARSGTSGGGAIAGAIIGAVIGRQMGGTHMARDAATAVGAVGGAVLGNEVEKNRNGGRDEVRVIMEMDGGGQATLLVPDDGGLRIGERVRVDGNRIYRL